MTLGLPSFYRPLMATYALLQACLFPFDGLPALAIHACFELGRVLPLTAIHACFELPFHLGEFCIIHLHSSPLFVGLGFVYLTCFRNVLFIMLTFRLT